MRVEAAVFPGGPCESAVILGRRRAPGSPRDPDMWSGHLVAIADGRYLLDPTITQVERGRCPPLVVEFPPWWIESGEPIFLDVPGTLNAMVRHIAMPRRGGYQRAPDFRLWKRRICALEAMDRLARVRAVGDVYDAFVRTLDNPPPAGEKLKALMGKRPLCET